jgi:hypothetical protein
MLREEKREVTLTAKKKRFFGFVEILTKFFSTLMMASARNASASAAVASPLER